MAALVSALVLVAPFGLDLPPEIDATAVATAPADRLDPPPLPIESTTSIATGSSAVVDGRCVGWEPLLADYSPGWSIERMSRIMYRESRCQPAVRNRSGATGLLQIMPMHCAWLAGCSVQMLRDAAYNIRAGAALWRRQGYQAWAT
jgi:hypothetical protein